jgi:hypothetical protein
MNFALSRGLMVALVMSGILSHLAVPQSSHEPSSSPGSGAKLDAFVRHIMDSGDMPGLQAAVVKGNKVVWSGSYGRNRFEANARRDGPNLFQAGEPGTPASRPDHVSSLSRTQSAARQDQPPEKLSLPGPSAQNLLLGNWSINAQASPNEGNLGSGLGTELWYPGPGGRSLIEELHLPDRQGRPIDAYGPAWWDPREQGQPFLWCTNNLPQGCVLSANVMRWEGDRYVYREDRELTGQNVRREEVFSEITAHSFLQTISAGPVGSKLISTWTAKATRRNDDLPRMSFPAPPIASESSSPSPAELSRLTRAFAGSWSIRLSFAPSEQMPKGGSGTGQEVWRAGPGGRSLIEEYHSIGADGELSGLGTFWLDEHDPHYFPVLWCDSTNPLGCIVMKHGAKWEGEQLEVTNEREKDSKKFTFKEVFSDITGHSFTQTLYQGHSDGDLKRLVTIKAIRKDAPQVPPGNTSALTAPTSQIQNLTTQQIFAPVSSDSFLQDLRENEAGQKVPTITARAQRATGDSVHSVTHGESENLGSIHFPISCSPWLQKSFERGVALLHSFWYGEARKEFESVAQQEPRCDMAYWGIAMIYWPQLMDWPGEGDIRGAHESLLKAGDRLSPRTGLPQCNRRFL